MPTSVFANIIFNTGVNATLQRFLIDPSGTQTSLLDIQSASPFVMPDTAVPAGSTLNVWFSPSAAMGDYAFAFQVDGYPPATDGFAMLAGKRVDRWRWHRKR